ncbi:MAG TPA: AAA family ATPase, partial [Rhodanobacteraceae bacterium]|nr:AAA family ATPase [Rhodanobacteraceae bacterium]
MSKPTVYELPAKAPKPPPLRVVAIGDLGEVTVSPVRLVVELIIPRGMVTLFGGHGGSGKSMLALTLIAHVACGVPWNRLPCVQGRVLYVSLEDPADVVRWRLRTICSAYGLDMSIVATNVTILDGTESEEAALMREIRMDGVTAAIETEALSQIAQLADGASLIVIDNASDAADFDENNRRFVRTFIRRLGRIGRAVDAGVLLLAHIDKNAAKFGAQGNSYSGSTAWHNSVRSRLALIE